MSFQEELKRVYGGHRVLVTGHTGFKGAWLVHWLRILGADICGLALDPPSVPSLFEITELTSCIHDCRLNINDYTALSSVFEHFQPEIVLHLAAQSLVRPSYDDPLNTFSTNILGTAHVLEACRRTSSVKVIVCVTSDKCYRNNEWVWGYRENDPMGGFDPYSASKGCAELVIDSFINSFFTPEAYGKKHHIAIASARAGNAIGGGDWATDRLIPDCIRALHAEKIIHIRNSDSVRPWQHALECLSGYLTLGAKLWENGPKFNGGWNFSPIDSGDLWTVERIVRHICHLWPGGNYRIDKTEQPHEAHLLNLDSTKANILLKWRPRYNIEKALLETVNWYREWNIDPSSEHMIRITQDQIESYMCTTVLEV